VNGDDDEFDTGISSDEDIDSCEYLSLGDEKDIHDHTKLVTWDNSNELTQ